MMLPRNGVSAVSAVESVVSVIAATCPVGWFSATKHTVKGNICHFRIDQQYLQTISSFRAWRLPARSNSLHVPRTPPKEQSVMPSISPAWTMIGLDILMVIYTLWVLSLGKPIGKRGALIGAAMLVWLAALHVGLSNQSLFPQDMSGVAFLVVIFAAVGGVGAALLLIPSVRHLLLNLDQRQLLLLQGIRVFFGATFLMQAGVGVLPQAFGMLDGVTHIGAGFFGLIAAFSVAAGVHGARRAWFANLFGLADILVVASSLALVLLPQIGPHHSMMYAVFLPAPLWLWFHLISMWKLIRVESRIARPAHASGV
jgi:hypothetical protein